MPAKHNGPRSCCCTFPLALILVAVVAIGITALLAAAAIGYIYSGKIGGSSAWNFQNSYGTLRTITVTASGSASAAPDTAKIMISLNGTGATPALANANLSASVSAMNRTMLPFLNGNTSLIQTTGYQISPATNCTYPNSTLAMPYYCITHKLPYYVASESFEISVPSIRNSSAAITGLSAVPSIQLEGVQAALSTGRQGVLNQEALSMALTNATAQAQLLAGSGVRIQVENITVQYGQVYYPVAYATLSGATGKAAANSSAFFGGEATTLRSVRAVFSIR